PETEDRAIGGWLAGNLIRAHIDSSVAARVARPRQGEELYNLSRDGRFELKDNQRQGIDLMLPLAFALLLGLCITMGGQYLLQGVSEEKESRILESLLCTVSPGELMAGKLFGLGGAGLLLVGLWSAIGAITAGPGLAALGVTIPPSLLLIALVYFLIGYLFYGSLLTGIGAMTNNMREAQQFSFGLTFLNFIPLVMFVGIVGRPNSAIAVFFSMFPVTAPTEKMMALRS